MGIFEKAQEKAVKDSIPAIKKGLIEELNSDEEFRKQLKEVLLK